MSNLNNYMPTRMPHPGLLGRNTFDDVFEKLFHDSFPALLKQSTRGYPVADIYQQDGDTVMEFALAGFRKDELAVDVKPDKRSITVRATTANDSESSTRRIARRSFEKTYINYDDNLDLGSATAKFENGLLRVVVPTRPESKPRTIKIG